MLTRRAAVLGSPIEHSLSPVLHRAAYQALGLDGWTYDRFEVDAPGLAGFLAGLGVPPDPQWAGLSLTMPLKEEALVLAEHCDPVALQTGAVNTLVPSETGWWGYNTDVHGVVAALTDAGVGSTVPATSALVLGSGATARSVLAACAELSIGQVTFAVRRDARESTLAQARDHRINASVLTMHDAAASAPQFPVVISTVPPGGADDFAAHVPQSGSPSAGSVWLDAVYAGWPTSFATAGAAAGAGVRSGLEMLIHQAVRQVELMTGRRPPLDAVQTAGRAALAAHQA